MGLSLFEFVIQILLDPKFLTKVKAERVTLTQYDVFTRNSTFRFILKVMPRSFHKNSKASDRGNAKQIKLNELNPRAKS